MSCLLRSQRGGDDVWEVRESAVGNVSGEKHVAPGVRSEDVGFGKMEEEGGRQSLRVRGQVEDGEWERLESVERTVGGRISKETGTVTCVW